METILTARSRRCLPLVEITNLTCHRFNVDSWHHIYTDIISFQSWDDWLVTHFINKSGPTHEVVFREVLGAYRRVSCQFQFSPRLLHEIDPLLSPFLLLHLYRKEKACRTITFCTSGKVVHPPTRHLPGTFQVQYRECSDK